LHEGRLGEFLDRGLTRFRDERFSGLRNVSDNGGVGIGVDRKIHELG
jgi:hypothetical protein